MQKRLRAAFAAAILTVSLLFQAGCAEATPVGEIAVTASVTERTISIQWDEWEGSDRCRVFRKEKDGSDFKFVCDVLDSSSYLDSYVRQGTEYLYKIKIYSKSTELAEGISPAVSLSPSPAITLIRQIEGSTYEVEWDRKEKECIVFGQNASGWKEIGRGSDGVLRFENTENCTHLAVSSTGKDAVRSDPVAFASSGSIHAVTAIEDWTNALEFDVSEGGWTYEFSRSETKDGPYASIGTANSRVFYDVKEEDDSVLYWYRVRCVGDRFESVWSEPVQVGTNAKKVFYLPVLVYHEFLPKNERAGTLEYDEDVIAPEEFESDLIWLKQNGYTTVSAADLIGFLEGEKNLPEKPVLLTIDDGKYSVYKWAWPLLVKHGMKATLALIGDQIDSATQSPEERENTDAPFCTWEEIAEMSASGAIEMISHTQDLHAFSHDGRQGANLLDGESAEQYLPLAEKDLNHILGNIELYTGKYVPAMAYPYSIRSEESDKAWLAAGYKLLLCGNSGTVHKSKWNPMIREAGLNAYSARLRRIGRIEGTSIAEYLTSFEDLLSRNGIN